MIFWGRPSRIFSRLLKSYNVIIYQEKNYQKRRQKLWSMKERKQRIVLKRKKADEGITWKQESCF